MHRRDDVVGLLAVRKSVRDLLSTTPIRQIDPNQTF